MALIRTAIAPIDNRTPLGASELNRRGQAANVPSLTAACGQPVVQMLVGAEQVKRAPGPELSIADRQLMLSRANERESVRGDDVPGFVEHQPAAKQCVDFLRGSRRRFKEVRE
jgi:hypothetical protein